MAQRKRGVHSYLRVGREVEWLVRVVKKLGTLVWRQAGELLDQGETNKGMWLEPSALMPFN